MDCRIYSSYETDPSLIPSGVEKDSSIDARLRDVADVKFLIKSEILAKLRNVIQLNLIYI